MTPRSIGPTGSLALVVHHRWEPNSLWMIVTSYFDMSGPDGRIPLMVYGGFVAKLGQWNRFDAKWRKMLKRAGLTYFRAKEMRHGEGEFRGWGDDQKEKLVGKMEKIAQGNSLFGFTVRLDDADFRNYYIPKVKPKKVNFDSRYGVCFRSAISFLPYMVKDALGRSDFTLNVVVEEGDKNVGASYEIFKELRKEQNWEYAGNLGEVTIGSKKKFPGLQAADLIAHLAWKLEQTDNYGYVLDLVEASHSAAQKVEGSKAPLFRLHTDKAILKDLRDQTISMKEVKRRYWHEK